MTDGLQVGVGSSRISSEPIFVSYIERQVFRWSEGQTRGSWTITFADDIVISGENREQIGDKTRRVGKGG